METKVCKICGQEKPTDKFRRTKSGSISGTCNECYTVKLRETLALKRQSKFGGGNYHDPEFDNRDPNEVIQLMGRAKRWLEARGYEIRLEGEYKKTTIHKIRF